MSEARGWMRIPGTADLCKFERSDGARYRITVFGGGPPYRWQVKRERDGAPEHTIGGTSEKLARAKIFAVRAALEDAVQFRAP